MALQSNCLVKTIDFTSPVCYCCSKTTAMALENYVNVIEAAHTLRIHPESVKRLIRRGELSAVKVGNVWLIDRHNLDIFAGTYDRRRGSKRRLL